jgi:uncharacterized Rmd1/YagE family protein
MQIIVDISFDYDTMNTSTQESNMDNLTIVIAGLIALLTVLVVTEALAKFFDWE